MKKAMKKKGFTLVEIMIVVAIIGLLAAIGIPSFQKARANTMKKSAINNARLVIGAVEQYQMEEGIADGSTDVTPANYQPYIKGCTAASATGLTIGNETVTADIGANNTDTAEALAAEMYPDIFTM